MLRERKHGTGAPSGFVPANSPSLAGLRFNSPPSSAHTVVHVAQSRPRRSINASANEAEGQRPLFRALAGVRKRGPALAGKRPKRGGRIKYFLVGRGCLVLCVVS